MVSKFSVLFISVVLIGCANVFNGDDPTVDAPEQLIQLLALYDFNEGRGDIVYDTSGFGEPLNLVITDPSGIKWEHGRLAHNSASRIISSSAASKISENIVAQNSLTFEAWVKPNNISQNSARIFSISSSASVRNISLEQGSTEFVYRAASTKQNQNGIPGISTVGIIPQNELVHLVGTWNGRTGERRIYINGELNNTELDAGSLVGWDDTFNLILGNEVTDESPWFGEYYSLSIFSGVISESEITGSYNNGVPEDHNNLLALYTFDQRCGLLLVCDTSGIGVPLDLDIVDNTETGTDWLPGRLKINASTRIQSSDAASKVTDAAVVNNALTVEAWIKPDNVSSELARIISISQSGTEQNFVLEQNVDSFKYKLKASSVLTDLNTVNSAANTKLTHIVLTWDGNTRENKIYINGELNVSVEAGLNLNNWDTSFRLLLGNEFGVERPWLGEFYYLAFYQTTKTADEILSDYNYGVPIDYQQPVARYTFDDAAGGMVVDSSGVGQSLDLTIEDMTAVKWNAGSISIREPTRITSSISASKISSSVKKRQAITIEAWVRPANITQPGKGPSRIVSVSVDSDSRNFTFSQDGDSYDLRFRTSETNSNGGPAANTGAGTLVPNLTHVVSTWDGLTGESAIYVNSELLVQHNAGTDIEGWSDSLKLIFANEFDDDRIWLGDMHYVAVYSRVLLAEEIFGNYNQGIPLDHTAPIALYTFNEGTDDIVNDQSGVGDPLDLLIPDLAAVEWKLGRLNVLSATRIASTTASSKITNELTRTNALTLEVWVSNSISSGIQGGRIASISGNAANRNVSLLQFPDGRYSYRLRVPPATSENGTPSLPSLNSGNLSELKHIVLTWDGKNNKRDMYIDGILDSSDILDGSIIEWDNTYRLIIANEFTDNIREWIGEYYYMSIYARPLSDTEIATHYNNGVPLDHQELVANYSFNDGAGNIVADSSGGTTPLNLTIPLSAPVVWQNDYLSVTGDTTGATITSVMGAAKISEQVIFKNAVTIEAWITPSSIAQGSAARIVGISGGKFIRNTTIGQTNDQFMLRHRTTNTNEDGDLGLLVDEIDLYTGVGTAKLATSYLVSTWNGATGEAKIYVDGVLESVNNVGGTTSGWDNTFPLIIANEVVENRHWLGDFHHISISARTLSADEISQNFMDGEPAR